MKGIHSWTGAKQKSRSGNHETVVVETQSCIEEMEATSSHIRKDFKNEEITIGANIRGQWSYRAHFKIDRGESGVIVGTLSRFASRQEQLPKQHLPST